METFVVEATRINPHPWRYIAVPGYEILSQCDTDQTEAVARHVANSLELDRRLMPSGSWGELTVPLTFIMFDFKPANSLAPFVPKSLETKDAAGYFGDVLIRGNIVYLGKGEEKGGGVDTGDSDTQCVVQNRWNAPWNWSGGAAGRGPIPLGLLFRLNSAVPPMPAWFTYGLVGPCGLLRIRPVRDPESQEFRGMLVAAARWLTDGDTTSLVTNYKNNHKIPVLPPIRDLFHPDPAPKPSSLADWPSPDFMAEAALFVRWGMTPVAEEGDRTLSLTQQWFASEARRLNEAHRIAFARFLDRSRTEPVTESVFRECFGFGYAEMQSVLNKYLVTTSQEPFVLNQHAMQGWSQDDPVASIRAATADEIGRIVGDWLRMQAASFPDTHSAEREAYLRAAGHVLERAFRDDNDLSSSVRLLPPKDAQLEPRDLASQNTEVVEKSVVISPSKIHDPRLLAVYGLYYFDIGDSTSARVLLEATVRAKTPRPAAYVALAQLNRAAALAKPASDNGKFSTTQVAAILTPLFTVIKNWNLDVGGYLLIADTWSHSAVKPSLANLHVLVDGLHRYPFDSSLLCSTAELYAQWGYREEANETVERSLRFADLATAEKLRLAQSTWGKKK